MRDVVIRTTHSITTKVIGTLPIINKIVKRGRVSNVLSNHNPAANATKMIATVRHPA